MKRHHQTVLFLVLIHLPGLQLHASQLWGGLKKGPHAVGFKTVFTYDPSRPSLTTSTNDTQGRQMQINVWYPASRTQSRARPMLLEDYVYLISRELNFSPLNKTRERESIEKFKAQTIELGGNAETLQSLLPKLLKMPVAAIRNAPLAAGSFPLVIYPDAPARHSILCEYLASHGYVVAATSLKGTLEQELDVALTGIETITSDIQFVAGSMKTWPNVDRKKLALIGLGITASGALNAQMRNPEVDALVSLDGGIPTLFEDRLLKRAPYFDIAAFNVPLLAIYAPHPNVDPAILDQYKYSTRYYVHFPKMSEFHFLNYGMFEQFVPSIIGKAPGDTKSGFELAARYVLAFLGTHLKNDAQASQFLDANSAPSELVQVNKKIGLVAPPKFFEIKRMIRSDGIQSFVALYRRLKASDPQPFSQTLLVDLFNWASFQRDPEWKERKEIALVRIESFPQSSRAHFTLGQVAMQTNERELARKHYQEALRLLENDDDPVLDSATRKRIGQVATQNLETLGK